MPDPAVATRFVLDRDTQPSPALQAAVAQADARICEELGIEPSQRSFGVVDLAAEQCALLRPDALFYGASVPKICIALGYFTRFPQTADQLDPQVYDELARMIKRSSNELAAKYSRAVGLDFLQDLQRRYGLYDNERGGLWCGKHYGYAEPRTGDPVGDHSHAVTVRQCLRFYLMLERGDLGAAVSQQLRRVFRATHLPFHEDNFVSGLVGRDVTVYRKNGLWEDWHLDTARVRHGDKVYLLAGATRHPDGGRYLAAMAGAVDEILCGKEPKRADRHRLHRSELGVVLDGGETHASAEYSLTSEQATIWFNEAVLSWNVTCDERQSFVVELRVGRPADEGGMVWSPWLHVGDWGEAPPREERVTSFDGGGIDIDYFRSTERYSHFQYRVRAGANEGQPIRVARMAVCLSDTTGLPTAVEPASSKTSDSPAKPQVLAIPFRSQKTEQKEIAGRICSPTSVSMVLAYHKIEESTLAVAQACLDAAHDLYGIWPRNVQAAWMFGSPGYLTRFSDWSGVEQMIAAGQPLIISIRVKQAGDLRNAPYKTTAGHLLVLHGFSGEDMVHVSDPAASTAETGQLTYYRKDLENVWMRATGGLTYVLEAPPATLTTQAK